MGVQVMHRGTGGILSHSQEGQSKVWIFVSISTGAVNDWIRSASEAMS